MSRLSPESSASGPPGASAVLHWVDGGWSAIRFEPGGAGIRVLGVARLDRSEIAAWLGDAAHAVRVVIPARAVVARSMRLGHGNEAALDQRLQSQIQDRMDDTVPMHRMAATVTPSQSGEDDRTGVAVSWPQRQDVRLPGPGDELLGVPDIAGLLSLMGRQRVDLPMLWHDAADGSTALVLAGLGRMAVRSTHIDGLHEGDALPRFIMESALQAGWSADEMRSLAGQAGSLHAEGPTLLLPDSVRAAAMQRVTGEVPEDLDRYGIALGCALATTDDYAAMTVLRPSLPTHVSTRSELLVERFSDRSFAIRLAVALVLLVLLGPLVTNGIRYGLLSLTHGDLDEAVGTAAMVEQRNTLYANLGSGAVPVTKLLADVASATPLGIKVDSVKMGAGEPLRIHGDATAYDGLSAAELIGLMKSRMQDGRVFKNVTVEWAGQTNLGERSFSLSADIAAASLRPRYAVDQDFAAWTFQQRRHHLPKTAEGGPPPRPSEAARWDPDAHAAATSDLAATDQSATPAGSGTASSVQPIPATTPNAAVTTPGGGSTASAAGGGQPASNTPPSAVPRRTGHAGGANRPDRTGGGLSARDTDSRSIADQGARSGDLSAEDLGALPEILSKDQIAVLSREETLSRIREVSSARQRVADPEISETLVEYWKELFEHLRSLPAENEP
ncbi:MAG: hypothetical protein QF561_00510 [Phycisphaerales bacterium]|jgi:hypothetical protein|nr:hypothetical protein [Phycisphaerales bacterium]